MIIPEGNTFSEVFTSLKRLMKDAPVVRTERWQGRDVSRDPAATSYELRNVMFEVPLWGVEELQYWREDIGPNLPWADDHMKERVGGEPLNPGVEWANWPWGKSAARFRDENQIFNHTYMERLWPKYARTTDGGRAELLGENLRGVVPDLQPRRGVAWEYGDLQDLVEMLAHEPFTRQAYIGLWFPEDVGVADGGRKVCTLGYQFLVRQGVGGHDLHVWYPMRSCDLRRHFKDDVYLAVRLLLWVLDRCRERAPEFWRTVRPGTYAMHMTSLHIFENDRRELEGGGWSDW